MVVSMKDVLHCESEYNRGAGCGKIARPDLYGGLCVNEVPTMTAYIKKLNLGVYDERNK
jgi:hypothetical protein